MGKWQWMGIGIREKLVVCVPLITYFIYNKARIYCIMISNQNVGTWQA